MQICINIIENFLGFLRIIKNEIKEDEKINEEHTQSVQIDAAKDYRFVKMAR